MNILIAEDFEDTRMVLTMALQSRGYTVLCANDGAEALSMVKEKPVDLIISDIMMPHMDGFDFCRAIKTDDVLSHIPFIFYTATYIEDEDRALAMAAGASRFIIKPMDMDKFLPMVDDVLGEYYQHQLSVPESPQADEHELGHMHERVLTHKLDKKIWQLERERRGLALSEMKYKTLFESSGDAVMLLDDKGLLDCNLATVNIFGYSSRHELLAKQAQELSPATQPGGMDSQQLMDEHIHKALTEGSERFEWQHRRLDGSEFPAEVRLTAIELEGKTILQSIVHDISERKQNEAQLRKLSSCVEQAGEAIIITDRDGSIEYVNPSFSKLTGYAMDEAIGNNPNMLNSGNQDAGYYESMWSTILAGRTWQGKVIDKRKDGSFYPAFLTISPIHDQSASTEHFTHFVGIQSDLTQLKDAEARFQQAQKMEAIGTLVGGIAHDFNNILAGMTGNIYLAQERVSHMPDVSERLGNIEQLAGRAADMIKQLLTFARKDRVSMQVVPLAPFIKETLKLLRPAVPENIAMHEHICSESLQIKGDATQLHQVLMNLTNNARDALENVDAPVITIGLEHFTADDAFVQKRSFHINARHFAYISIADNGCGISDKQIRHLFEPFFTTKEQGKGTGLGLAMVYGAVKSHNGFVEVQSKPGKGTTFHIYLPLLETPSDSKDAKSSEQPVMGNGECILLVDDEQNVLNTTRDVLISLGYQVLTATNGRTALDMFKSHVDEIDLCIFDIIMPEMGGEEAVRRIRRIKPAIKIIFSTGYDKLSRSNMVNETVISKPFPIEEMSRLIRRELDH